MGSPEPAEWAGVVYATEHLILGFGFLYAAVDGRWWICFERMPGVRKVKTAHRCGRLLLKAAQQTGLVIHALADLRIDGAERWLERLGFAATGEMIEGRPVWVRK